MYTVVNFLPKIEVFAVRGDERRQLGLGSHDFREAREAHEQLVFDAKFYGDLADEISGDAAIEIAITRFFIDPRSARLSATRRSFFYDAEP